ncbi:MAG TPA: hypothetical protein VIV06_00485 [Candidatus Limnocylindrales bacterium]
MTGACGSCGRFHEALLDFVDRREMSERTQLALAHLECCDECRAEMESLARTIGSLRRLGDAAGAARLPDETAAVVLRSRVGRRTEHRRSWQLALGGKLVAAALVAVVVGPLALRQATGDLAPIAEPTDARPDAPGAPAAHRIYDPPAQSLTADLVTVLSGTSDLGRPRQAKAFTQLPTATDRTEPGRKRAAPVASTVSAPPRTEAPS